jgi:hypothetical protein
MSRCSPVPHSSTHRRLVLSAASSIPTPTRHGPFHPICNRSSPSVPAPSSISPLKPPSESFLGMDAWTLVLSHHFLLLFLPKQRASDVSKLPRPLVLPPKPIRQSPWTHRRRLTFGTFDLSKSFDMYPYLPQLSHPQARFSLIYRFYV